MKQTGIDIAPSSRPGGVPVHITPVPPKGTPTSPAFGSKPVLTNLPKVANPFAVIGRSAKSLVRRLAK